MAIHTVFYIMYVYIIWRERERDTGEEGDVEVEARGVEGPVVGMAVGGLEVAIGLELGRVPQPAPEIGQERELRPQQRDLSDEDRVLVNGSKCVVE